MILSPISAVELAKTFKNLSAPFTESKESGFIDYNNYVDEILQGA